MECKNTYKALYYYLNFQPGNPVLNYIYTTNLQHV